MISTGLFCLSLVCCSQSLKWIAEPKTVSPSCVPDRLPLWEDFVEQTWEHYSQEDRSVPATAQIAVNFRAYDNPPHIVMEFDYDKSWVRAEFRTLHDHIPAYIQKTVLAHEQVHYMISCMVTRQANMKLQAGGDLVDTFEWVETAAKQINTQYDEETNHGQNKQSQAKWEADIQQQFDETSRQIGRILVDVKELIDDDESKLASAKYFRQ